MLNAFSGFLQAKALAEKNMRDLLAQKEQAERNVMIFSIKDKKFLCLQLRPEMLSNCLNLILWQRLAEALDADVKRWSNGKEGNLRALLSTLQYVCARPVPTFYDKLVSPCLVLLNLDFL